MAEHIRQMSVLPPDHPVRPGPVPSEVLDALSQAREACAAWGKVPAGSVPEDAISSGIDGLACEVLQEPTQAMEGIFYTGMYAGVAAAFFAYLALRAVIGTYRAIRHAIRMYRDDRASLGVRR